MTAQTPMHREKDQGDSCPHESVFTKLAQSTLKKVKIDSNLELHDSGHHDQQPLKTLSLNTNVETEPSTIPVEKPVAAKKQSRKQKQEQKKEQVRHQLLAKNTRQPKHLKMTTTMTFSLCLVLGILVGIIATENHPSEVPPKMQNLAVKNQPSKAQFALPQVNEPATTIVEPASLEQPEQVVQNENTELSEQEQQAATEIEPAAQFSEQPKYRPFRRTMVIEDVGLRHKPDGTSVRFSIRNLTLGPYQGHVYAVAKVRNLKDGTVITKTSPKTIALDQDGRAVDISKGVPFAISTLVYKVLDFDLNEGELEGLTLYAVGTEGSTTAMSILQ